MLEPGEPMAMNFISTAFVCDASNVTGIVDRLVKQGLIERQDHPTDRRIKMISLTAHGIELKNAMTAEVVAAETERLEPVLDDAERQTLKNLLQKILASSENAQ
jgi:DNA-binding MarR family transcriptional regulator